MNDEHASRLTSKFTAILARMYFTVQQSTHPKPATVLSFLRWRGGGSEQRSLVCHTSLLFGCVVDCHVCTHRVASCSFTLSSDFFPATRTKAALVSFLCAGKLVMLPVNFFGTGRRAQCLLESRTPHMLFSNSTHVR